MKQLFSTTVLLLTFSLIFAQTNPIAQWNFNEKNDNIQGNFKYVEGINGKALRSDGFSTRLVCSGKSLPLLAGDYSIDAWIALRAYPWNDCAIVNQEKERKSGYLFGINAEGKLIMQYAAGNKWHECISPVSIPLYEWTYVAATVTKLNGITLYINGKEVSKQKIPVEMVPPRDTDLVIARNIKSLPPYPEVRTQYAVDVSYSFDGYLDEIRIFNKCLQEAEILTYYKKNKPKEKKVMSATRMPSGESNAKFGAYYTNLSYTEQWDDLWRGNGEDIVVSFGEMKTKIVFWRGISYAPCFVTEKDNWLSHEFMERPARQANMIGCLESMSDKQARYSAARIIENTPARILIHWRNSPVDKLYRIPFTDSITNWGDWSDEYYTIYPDGVVVREITMWSSGIEKDDYNLWYEWAQTLPLMHAGQSPEDIFDWEKMMTIANLKGEEQLIKGPSERIKFIDDACIQVNYLKSQYNPFLIMWPEGARIEQYFQELSGYSRHPWWNHWPVAQVASGGRYSTTSDRPSHSCTSTQWSADFDKGKDYITKLMLCGFTDKDAGDLLPLAKSWANSPSIVIDGDVYVNKGYDFSQRCYVIECVNRNSKEKLSLSIPASTDIPVINPAFVIKNYQRTKINVMVNGVALHLDTDYKVGIIENLDGSTNTIIWINKYFSKITKVSIF